MRNSRGFTVIELVAVVAIIALLATMLLPVLGQVRWVARRSVCMGQLRSAIDGLLSYASSASNKGYLPTRGFKDTQFDVIGRALTSERGLVIVLDEWQYRPADSNSRNLFLAVRLKHIQPGLLVCPNTEDKPAATASEGQTHYDFDVDVAGTYESKLSYSYHLQFTDRDDGTPGYPLTNSSDTRMAVLADRNPFVIYRDADGNTNRLSGGGFEAVDVSIPTGVLASGVNSPNHDGRGQNVAFRDGRVKWTEAPTVGPDARMISGQDHSDNIYTVWDDDDHTDGTIAGDSMPEHELDCFLVP